MVKAKENKKVVGSYKTVTEAAQAMIDAGRTSTQNIFTAAWNIRSAMNGSEARNISAASHTYARHTAYGYEWSETATGVKVTKTPAKPAAKKAPAKSTKTVVKKAASTKKSSKKTSK